MIAPTKSDDGVLFWVLAGTAALAGAHRLLSGPGELAFPVSVQENLKDLNAVASRFSRVRDLFQTGYIGVGETLGHLDGLLTSVEALRQAGRSDPSTTQQLVSRIDSFSDQVRMYG
jgi:hypothetical protein